MEMGSVAELRFHPVGAHSQGTSIDSATPLTAPSGALKLLLQALTHNIRYTLDGTAPTTSKGFRLAAGDIVTIPVQVGQIVYVISETSGASVEYQWGDY